MPEGGVAAEILELVLAFVGVALYGRPGQPRPVIWRALLRLNLFAGILAGFAWVFFLPGVPPHPAWVAVWGLLSLIPLIVERDLGLPWVAWAGWGGVSLLFLTILLGHWLGWL